MMRMRRHLQFLLTKTVNLLVIYDIYLVMLNTASNAVGSTSQTRDQRQNNTGSAFRDGSQVHEMI